MHSRFGTNIKKYLLSEISRLSLLMNQDWFTPAKAIGFFMLNNRGKIITLGDFSKNGEIMQKTGLEQTINMPLQWYPYFQITNLLRTKQIQQVFRTPLMEIENIIHTSKDSQKSLISKIYKIILGHTVQKPVLYQNLWTMDCSNRL